MANCTQCGKRVGLMPGVCPACLDSADPSWREESARARQGTSKASASTMRFRNPANGYTESKANAWLGTLLLGGLYLLGSGLWAAFLAWLVVAFVALLAFGGAAVLAMCVVNILFAAMTPNLVRTKYLRKGWIEVSANDTVKTTE